MFADLTCGALSELESGRSWSSQEIAMHVAAGAARLRAHGLQRGDRLFILYGNKLEFFVDLLAAWNVGASVVPVDNRLTRFEVDNLARMVTPKIALTDGTVPTALGDALVALESSCSTPATWRRTGNIGTVGQRILRCAAR